MDLRQNPFSQSSQSLSSSFTSFFTTPPYIPFPPSQLTLLIPNPLSHTVMPSANTVDIPTMPPPTTANQAPSNSSLGFSHFASTPSTSPLVFSSATTRHFSEDTPDTRPSSSNINIARASPRRNRSVSPLNRPAPPLDPSSFRNFSSKVSELEMRSIVAWLGSRVTVVRAQASHNMTHHMLPDLVSRGQVPQSSTTQNYRLYRARGNGEEEDDSAMGHLPEPNLDGESVMETVFPPASPRHSLEAKNVPLRPYQSHYMYCISQQVRDMVLAPRRFWMECIPSETLTSNFVGDTMHSAFLVTPERAQAGVTSSVAVASEQDTGGTGMGEWHHHSFQFWIYGLDGQLYCSLSEPGSKAASEQHISKALTSHISPFPQSLTTGLHLQRPQSLTPSTAIKLQQTTQHDRRREEEKTMQHDSRRDDATEIAPVAAVAVAVEIDQPLAHRCLPSPLSHRCLPPPQQKLMTNKKSAAFCLRVYPDCYEVSVQNT
nr:hypothetical protein Iba_chr03fCG3390 [Ipomoea batatas]